MICLTQLTDLSEELGWSENCLFCNSRVQRNTPCHQWTLSISAVRSWDCSQPRVTHYNGDIMLGGSNILMMISILDFLLFFLNTLFLRESSWCCWNWSWTTRLLPCFQCNQTIKIKLSEWPDWNILFYFRPSYYKLGSDADIVRLKWMSVVSN